MVCPPCILMAMSATSGGLALSSDQKKLTYLFIILSIIFMIWYFYKKSTCDKCKE
jgi:hypothetical protein